MKKTILYDEAAACYLAVGMSGEDSFIILARFQDRIAASDFIGDLHDIQSGSHKRLDVLIKSEINSFDFDAVYKLYPRRVGKTPGLKWLKSNVKTATDYAALMAAVKYYAQYCVNCKFEEQYIKHFSTWVKEWRDWTTENVKNQEPEVRRLFDLKSFSHV